MRTPGCTLEQKGSPSAAQRAGVGGERKGTEGMRG